MLAEKFGPNFCEDNHSLFHLGSRRVILSLCALCYPFIFSSSSSSLGHPMMLLSHSCPILVSPRRHLPSKSAWTLLFLSPSHPHLARVTSTFLGHVLSSDVATTTLLSTEQSQIRVCSAWLRCVVCSPPPLSRDEELQQLTR